MTSKKQKAIQEAFDEVQKEKFKLQDLKNSLRKWWHFEDEEVIDVLLASLLGEDIDGDPLWLFLVAPAGSLKTEFIRAFQGERFYQLSDLTPHTFVTGLMLGSGEKRKKVKDLLPELNRKVLLFKDFTTILEKGHENRNEIFSQLREIYDGSFAKRLGTMDETIRYDVRFGLLAGVTPVIDNHWKVMQQLGERFLKVRWNENRNMTTAKSRANEGKEDYMRKSIKRAVVKYLKWIDIHPVPDFPEKYDSYLDHLAIFTATARTPLSFHEKGSFFYEQVPTPEQPTRLVKQMKRLAKLLAIVRHKSKIDDEEMKTLHRVALDTIPPDRRAVLESVHTAPKEKLLGCAFSSIKQKVKIPDTSLRRILEQLIALDLIKKTEIVSSSGSYIQKEEYYSVSPLYPPIFSERSEKIPPHSKSVER